jgi:uncharacterized protein YndB with AHSA1/START domain
MDSTESIRQGEQDNPVPQVGDTVVVERTIAASPEKVFAAWTDGAQLAKWFGPRGFTNPVSEFDPRPGGAINIHMTDPNGTVYPMGGTVHEIDQPRRLVFTSTAFENPDGSWQLEGHNTVTFEDDGTGGTKLAVHSRIVKATPEVSASLAGMREGWGESFDKLSELLTR